jgi:hypothetical protein
MNRKKLQKIQEELAGMRRRMVKQAEMESIAKQLGRCLVNRGKHPNWESEVFSHLDALSIPDHGGRDLTKTVRTGAIKALEQDIAAWEVWLDSNEGGNGNGS